jgi:hypothetical protein
MRLLLRLRLHRSSVIRRGFERTALATRRYRQRKAKDRYQFQATAHKIPQQIPQLAVVAGIEQANFDFS